MKPPEITATTINAVAEVAAMPPDPVAEFVDPYYEPYFCARIKELADEGLYPEEWAAQFDVSEYDMFNWISHFPEFARAYMVALTKLRAKFTHDLRKAANGKIEKAQAGLFTLLAKKRFPDLYGDQPDEPLRPVLPSGPQTIEGTVAGLDDPSDMATKDIADELAVLRRRHPTP